MLVHLATGRLHTAMIDRRSMGKPKVLGRCNICGGVGELSDEHMPPKKAYNMATTLHKAMVKSAITGQVRWRVERQQGGASAYVLCEPCNNNTGSWYGTPYVTLAKACAPHATPDNVGQVVEMDVPGISPMRVYKQALAIMCGSCGPGLAMVNPVIRELILNKAVPGAPTGMRLFCYLRANPGGKQTGVAGALGQGGKTLVVAEFSFWPIGWILAFGDSTDEIQALDAFDVTPWAGESYNAKRTVHVRLPCRQTVTHFPLDYRSTEQVLQDRARNLAGR